MIPRPYQNLVFLLLCFLCAAVPGTLWAADTDVEINASFNPSSLRNGEITVLAIAIEIPNDYHLYSMTKIPMGPLPLSIAVEDNQLEPMGDWYAAKPIVAFDGNFKKAVEYHDKKVIYSRVFTLLGKNQDLLPVRVAVRGQICNQNQCIPFKKQFLVPLSGEAGTARAQFTAVPKLSGESFPLDRPAPSAEEIEDFEPILPGLGLFGFLIIAFIAGLGALVTPCVFPMIPITVSFFSKYEKTSLRRSYIMAAIYAVSIIITFTLIGMFVSAVFGAVGMQALSSSPGFNLFLTALLVFFAFNLLGFYEINLPSWLVSRTSNKEQQLIAPDGSLAKQAGGVFFMALTFTMVSFTCTVGFIGIVLAEAARGNWFYPAIGMFSFSLAFSLPFFFLAVFPSFANKLQGKSGQWMVDVKAILGFLELAGAFKFLSNVDLVWQWGLITKPAVLACWALIFFAAGLHFLSIFPLLRRDKNIRPLSPIRTLVAIAMFAFSAYAYTGIRDNRDMGGWIDSWLPPTIYPLGGAAGGKTDQSWIVDDIEKGVARARKKSQPLFIDFTGYTCTNCRYMETSVFPNEKVHSRLKKMVRVTAYTDCTQQICETQREMQIARYGTAALPFYVILNPFDNTVLAQFASMTTDIDQFAAFLDKGITVFEKWAGEKATAAPDGGTVDPFKNIPVNLEKNDHQVNFRFPGLEDKKPIALSSLRGKWIFLNFWASWCSPCKKEFKEAFPSALASAPHITLVTVAFDGDETRAAALKIAREERLTEQVALQGGEDITEAGLEAAFDVSPSLPISYLIRPNGTIAWIRKGSVSKELLTRLFAQTKPKPH